MAFQTRKGQTVIPTGKYFYRDSSRGPSMQEAHYIECQMLPIHPQRFERIRKDNLKEVS